jgi:hypothetical protein
VCTLSSLKRTRENFPVVHPSQIAPSQAHLTWRFFRDRLPKKKMHLVGMDTLLILLSLGPGYHHPRGQDIALCCLLVATTSQPPTPSILGAWHEFVHHICSFANLQHKIETSKLGHLVTRCLFLPLHTIIFRENLNQMPPL